MSSPGSTARGAGHGGLALVTYAVARRRVERSYDLTAPVLKGGLSEAEWSARDIPVVPFPVEEARWKIEYSYGDALGLQVMLFPTAASKLTPVDVRDGADTDRQRQEQVARLLLGSGRDDRRERCRGRPGCSAERIGRSTESGCQPAAGARRASTRWLLAPLGLLLVVPLIVSGYYVRGWRRGRRAEALYGSRQRST